jgi:hypothetical protein
MATPCHTPKEKTKDAIHCPEAEEELNRGGKDKRKKRGRITLTKSSFYLFERICWKRSHKITA